MIKFSELQHSDAYSDVIDCVIEDLPLEPPREFNPKKTECKFIWKKDELADYEDAIPTITLDDIHTISLKGLSNDPKFREFLKEKLHKYLPYWTFAHDSPMIKLGTVKFKNKDGVEVEIPINKKRNKAALNFAFMRIRNQDNTWVKLLVIDVDKKYRVDYWKVCGFPEPNIETINPVSQHFQYIYLLAVEANPSEAPLYQNVMKAMVSELEGADKCAIGYNFRSPCYHHGRRAGKLIKRGKIQCGYNLVVVNHWNEVDLYYDLWLNFRPDELRDEMFDDDGISTATIDCTEHINKTTTLPTANKGDVDNSRHMQMIKQAWPICVKEFDPQKPSLELIVSTFKQFSSDLDDAHIHYHAQRQFDWCLKNIKVKWKKSQPDSQFSDLQRARRAFRTELDIVLNGQLQKDGAKFFKVSRSTFFRMLQDGRLIRNGLSFKLMAVKVGRNWVHINDLPCSESLEEEVDETNQTNNQSIIYGNVSLSPPSDSLLFTKSLKKNKIRCPSTHVDISIKQTEQATIVRWSEHGETIPEAAIRYGKNEKTIRRWIASGKLKKEHGKFYLVGVEAVSQEATEILAEQPQSVAGTFEPQIVQDQPLPVPVDPAHAETDEEELMRLLALPQEEVAPIVRSLPEEWKLNCTQTAALWDSQ